MCFVNFLPGSNCFPHLDAQLPFSFNVFKYFGIVPHNWALDFSNCLLCFSFCITFFKLSILIKFFDIYFVYSFINYYYFYFVITTTTGTTISIVPHFSWWIVVQTASISKTSSRSWLSSKLFYLLIIGSVCPSWSVSSIHLQQRLGFFVHGFLFFGSCFCSDPMLGEFS